MRRRSVARGLLACLAVVAALSAPATAVAHGIVHGIAHGHESAAQAIPMAGSGADRTRADRLMQPSVQSADGNADHLALHATRTAQTSGSGMPALPADRWPALQPTVRKSSARVVATAVIAYASHHDDAVAQPRAPPLG